MEDADPQPPAASPCIGDPAITPPPASATAAGAAAPRAGDCFALLDPRARTVRWCADAITTVILGGGALLAERFWLLQHDAWPFERLWLTPAAWLLLFARWLVYPPLWYRGWRYAVRDKDILICHGVLWRVRRAVPRQRIQHADIDSGPIDRMFGLCSLTLYTAGSADADAEIPGLTEATAEALRDRLLPAAADE